MPLQAPYRTGKVAQVRRFTLRRTAALAAVSFSGIFASVLGCGSGTLQAIAPQSTTAPVSSALGPQLGYLWLDSDHTLRPILGVTGASQIGQSVVPAGAYVGAVTAANANLAMLQNSDGSFDVMSLPSGSPTSLALKLPSGAIMRLSPTATSALIYTPGAAAASHISGLPSAPKVSTIKYGGPIVDATVSDTGSIAVEYSQGSSVALSVLALSGQPVTVASLGSPGGLSFLPGRDDLLYADGAANSLTLLRSATTTPSSSLIQTAALLKFPLAVGVSGSGRWALVVNRTANQAPGNASQSLVRIDLNTMTSSAVACVCTPTEAAVLADDGAFRVTNVKSGSNWIVDASKTTLRTLFIPSFPQTAKTSSIAANTVP